jgi:hypothetical protein
MTIDGWYNDYDWSVLFPHSYEEEGLEWHCDYYDYCWYFNDET